MAGQPTNADAIWAKLKTGINELYNKKKLSKAMYMDMYTNIYNNCENDDSSFDSTASSPILSPGRTKLAKFELYRRVRHILRSYVINLLKESVDLVNEDILNFYTKRWEEYEFCSRVLNGIFSPVQPKKKDESKGAYKMYHLALVTWRDNVFDKRNKKLTDATVELINRKRNGESINMQLVRSVISSHVKLGETCEHVLISNNFDILFDACQNLLRTDENDEHSHLYSLVLPVPSNLDELKLWLNTHFVQLGVDTIQLHSQNAVNVPQMYVNAILELHEKNNPLVIRSFKDNYGFVAPRSVTCRCCCINFNSIVAPSNADLKSAKLLSTFCDLLLKESSENPEKSQPELVDSLNRVMIIFKYTKDTQFSNKMAAKYRMHYMNASDDAKASMISELKLACDFKYTSKLQRTFFYMKMSEDLTAAFRHHLAASSEPLDFDFSVQVLSSRLWPFQQSLNFSLPSELERSISRFTTFYSLRHPRRRLKWLYSMSGGELITNCFENRYTLQVSTFQLAVLLQFNMLDTCTVGQLADLTQIKLDFLIQLVQILIKSKLLQCDVDENELNASSTVSLFTGFRRKTRCVNINIQSEMELKMEQESTHKHIEADYELLIQAAIVHIMKQRKYVSSEQLVAMVLKRVSLQFYPRVPMVKKCIDILIEKDFLARQVNRNGSYIHSS